MKKYRRRQPGNALRFPCLSRTPDRAEFLRFTDPYLTYPLGIITREDAPLISGLESLQGKRLAIVSHLIVYSKLTREHPDLTFDYVFTRTVDENLEAVAFNRADACIINLAAASYYIQKKGLTNLAIAGTLDWEGVRYSMGIRRDWPMLKQMVQKAIDTIPQSEKDRISQKWIRAANPMGVDIRKVWQWAFIAFACTATGFTFFLLWNRRLRMEILKKEAAEKALEKSRQELIREKKTAERYLNLAGVMFIGLDRTGSVTLANRKACQVLEFNEQEIMGKNWFSHFVPMAIRTEVQAVFQQVVSGDIASVEYYAFARQTDEMKAPLQPFHIVDEVLSLIRSSLPADINIVRDMDSDTFINGNATQLHQVLLNRCANAGQAMDKNGGTLTLRLKDIHIDTVPGLHAYALKPGTYVEISVADTGAGIPPDIIQQIFEPYFTTKAPGEGTGMGLAVAQGIVESHGGKIRVESVPDQGTMFRVLLPAVSAPRAKKKASDPTQLPTGNEHILLVDDEPAIVKVTALSLERLGYRVTATTRSPEALSIFESNPEGFDLVITDMTMPKMNGDVLTLKLLDIRPDIPIVLCTGFSSKVSEDRIPHLRISALLYKPVAKSDMARMVRQVLEKARVQSMNPERKKS